MTSVHQQRWQKRSWVQAVLEGRRKTLDNPDGHIMMAETYYDYSRFVVQPDLRTAPFVLAALAVEGFAPGVTPLHFPDPDGLPWLASAGAISPFRIKPMQPFVLAPLAAEGFTPGIKPISLPAPDGAPWLASAGSIVPVLKNPTPRP